MSETKYFKEIETEVHPKLLQKLDVARHISNIPYIITSAYRPDNPESAHFKRLAVDIQAETSYKRYQILRGLLDAGFKRIGIYPKHIHADIDLTKDLKVIWYGKYKN